MEVVGARIFKTEGYYQKVIGYKALANLAGSAGQCFHPSGMGGYRSYLG